jgi:hypothetical protein
MHLAFTLNIGLAAMTMIPIHRFDNPADLALAESMLEANNIPCFAHNRHFSGLYPGVQIELYNVCTLMVPQAAADEARVILQDLLAVSPDATSETVQGSPAAPAPRPGFRQIMRMVLEFFMFGWFIPVKAGRTQPADDTPE